MAWTLLLSFGIPGYRYSYQIFKGRAANSFAADGSDLSPFGHRVTRAAGNAMEWLVVPVALLMYAIATEQTAVTDTTAWLALAARCAQSTVHLVSTSPAAVNLRSLFLGIQAVIFTLWVIRFALA